MKQNKMGPLLLLATVIARYIQSDRVTIVRLHGAWMSVGRVNKKVDEVKCDSFGRRRRVADGDSPLRIGGGSLTAAIKARGS